MIDQYEHLKDREADLTKQRDNAHSDNAALRARIVELERDLEATDCARMAEIGFKLDARDKLEKANAALMKHVLIFDEIFRCLDGHKVFGDSITEQVAALGQRLQDAEEKCLKFSADLALTHAENAALYEALSNIRNECIRLDAMVDDGFGDGCGLDGSFIDAAGKALNQTCQAAADLPKRLKRLAEELAKHHDKSHLKEPELEHCDVCKVLGCPPL